MSSSHHLIHLQIRNPKDDETPIESATQIFSSLLPSHMSWFKRMLHGAPHYAFEIYLLNQTIYFYITVAPKHETFIQSLVSSSYPSVAIKKTSDPLEIVMKSPAKAFGEIVLHNSFTLPTKTYYDFRDIDLMSSVLGFLARRQANERIALQILISPATFPWSSQTVAMAGKMIHDKASDRYNQNPQKLLMMKKAAFQGGKAIIRVLSGTDSPDTALPLLQNLAGTFGAFSLGEGNQYGLHRPMFGKNKHIAHMVHRSATYMEHRHQILNAQELATIWHPPGYLLAGIKNIAWGKTLSGEPPENLPIAKALSEDERKEVNFFATTEFKNEDEIFGIRSEDRRKHMYVVGKTGAGKSTLIANMAIDDIRKDRGVGIIDPHGDLSEIILDYIPNRRIQDVIYLEPFDTERPFHLNVLESRDNQHSDLIASGIISIFSKLYKDSWGPRLEYILRNVILTLLQIPDATLVDVLPLLSQPGYRRKVIPYIQDQVLKNYWMNEFEKMPDKLKAESISPIQNKVGQFVSSTMIRNVIGHPKSTINLAEIMNEKKILIMNLSQGKLGEDNAALLGAMIINQVQLTAMARAYHLESDRQDFFLYVDEFQNFATTSFVKILSEARKYRLSLTLANQYTEQLEETIQRAIFGNIGTLISFVVGARDAYMLSKEFGELYTEADLVSLGKFETVMKLSIDNMTSSPFPAKTLPLPSLMNNNREKIIRLSKEKYGRKVNYAENKPIYEPPQENPAREQPHGERRDIRPHHKARPQNENKQPKSSQKHVHNSPQGPKSPPNSVTSVQKPQYTVNPPSSTSTSQDIFKQES